MKKFIPNELGWFCGYWNDSKLAVYLHQDRNKMYKKEKLHFHPDFYEYYLVIDGELVMTVGGKKEVIEKNKVLMVEPREVHRVSEFGPDGCIYAVVKSKSYDKSTIPVEET